MLTDTVVCTHRCVHAHQAHVQGFSLKMRETSMPSPSLDDTSEPWLSPARVAAPSSSQTQQWVQPCHHLQPDFFGTWSADKGAMAENTSQSRLHIRENSTVTFFLIGRIAPTGITEKVKTNKPFLFPLKIIRVIFIENIRSTKPWIPSVEELIKLAHSSLKGKFQVDLRYNNVQFKILSFLL